MGDRSLGFPSYYDEDWHYKAERTHPVFEKVKQIIDFKHYLYCLKRTMHIDLPQI